MPRRQAGLSEKHRRILEFLEDYLAQFGYPPSIREIGEKLKISSTSVVNYDLDRLEQMGYISREQNIARGIQIVKTLPERERSHPKPAIANPLHNISQAIEDLLHIPVLGRIQAGEPLPVPGSDLSYFDAETSIDVARSLLPTGERASDLFALQVQGDSMIDAMINDGDIVIMRRTNQARNGEMVAVWLLDKEETTLKYFYLDGNRVRLQPANPAYKPIIIDNPSTLEVQGKVVLVVRRVDTLAV